MADKLVLPNGNGTATILHTEADGTMHVEEWQDAEPILNVTEAARNQRFSAEDAMDGMLRWDGEIPFTILQKECAKRGIDISPVNGGVFLGPEVDLVIEAILADPAYAKLRVAPMTRDPRIIVRGRR